MADERLAAGIERIERALTRIAAVTRAPAAGAQSTAELDELRHRHNGLKAEVATALGELDGLARG